MRGQFVVLVTFSIHFEKIQLLKMHPNSFEDYTYVKVIKDHLKVGEDI